MAHPRTTQSRWPRAGRVDVQKGVRQLARSVRQIEVSLQRAERKIEADARARVRDLRNEARTQLAVLRGHQREATRILTRLSTASGGSWGDLKRAAERALRDARDVADSMIDRFRRAVSH